MWSGRLFKESNVTQVALANTQKRSVHKLHVLSASSVALLKELQISRSLLVFIMLAANSTRAMATIPRFASSEVVLL